MDNRYLLTIKSFVKYPIYQKNQIVTINLVDVKNCWRLFSTLNFSQFHYPACVSEVEKSPASNFPTGLSVSNCIKTILITAVIGVAKNMPIIPHNNPQKDNASRTRFILVF